MTELPSSISHAREAYSLASDGSTLTDFTEEASPSPSALSAMLARSAAQPKPSWARHRVARRSRQKSLESQAFLGKLVKQLAFDIRNNGGKSTQVRPLSTTPASLLRRGVVAPSVPCGPTSFTPSASCVVKLNEAQERIDEQMEVQRQACNLHCPLRTSHAHVTL